MNPSEHIELNCQIDGAFTKGFICNSHSPCVVSMLLSTNKNDSCRMYINSRAINKITVKYRFSLP